MGSIYVYAVPQRVTIKQIAAACGMAIPSVSQILNGKGSYHVDTRQRVQQLAREMGYRPNAYAQAMQSGRFNAVALVVATTQGLSYFEPDVVLALEACLAATNRHLVVARLPNEQLTDAGVVPRILRERMVDGLLIAYHAKIPPRMLALIDALGVPYVYINNNLPENAVHPDDFSGIKQATDHLATLGHRQIAFADFGTGLDETPWHYSSRARQHGYIAAMEAAGLTPQWWSQPDPIEHDARLSYALARLRESPRPTAIVCSNNETAGPLLIAAYALGIAVPQQLSLVTVDISAPRGFGRAIAYVEIPSTLIAQRAIELLDQRIAGASTPTVAVPMPFNPAGSVAPPPPG